MRSPQDSKVKFPANLSAGQKGPMLAALYQSTFPQLTAVAAGVLGRQEGAEDVVQLAASIALSKKTQFESEASFLAWMYSAVRNCALNERRKRTRRRTFATDPSNLQLIDNEPNTADTKSVDPSSGELATDQTAFEDYLLAALQDLSEEARCCLLLRTVHELSYAEIAEILLIPQGTAMSHVHRSRQLLRKQLSSKKETT
ncbi:ECF RNA polymerase sigma factor SigR [Bythopirellula polymerisocia]|uniref:ECF RNA polymerase sigma factor SigR n=1 Tax=Bythopirellula polymerisocia TaxID=2528003 RepID=A0A5C6CHQ1_9BACT|nr:ECF RNA polymerase sigma factor SigR [Bythopirellula polymerisocia]